MRSWLALTLGLALFSTPTFSQATTVDLQMLSWNVYMLPSPIKVSHQKERTVSIAASLAKSDYDVMLFQEAFSGGFREQMLKEVSARYPYSYYLDRDGKLLHVLGSGLFVMSRRPIKVIDHVYFNECKGADCFAAKGSFLFETENRGGRTVQYAVTHLQSMDGQGGIRLRQLAMIREMMSRHLQNGVAQLLVGDLNIDPADREYNIALKAFSMSSAPLIGAIPYSSGLKNSCYKVNGNKVSWIDHVLTDTKGPVRSMAMKARVFSFVSKGQTCPDSDHHAIETRVVFN